MADEVRRRQRWSWPVYLAILSFVGGIIWMVFLFPAINISSGELKPRSFYVDEHALLINSARFPAATVQADNELLKSAAKVAAQIVNDNNFEIRRIAEPVGQCDNDGSGLMESCPAGLSSAVNEICGYFIKSEQLSHPDCVAHVSSSNPHDVANILRPLQGLHHTMFLESIDIVLNYDDCSKIDAVTLAAELLHIVSETVLSPGIFLKCHYRCLCLQ
jgi:hypothetical protein